MSVCWSPEKTFGSIWSSAFDTSIRRCVPFILLVVVLMFFSTCPLGVSCGPEYVSSNCFACISRSVSSVFNKSSNFSAFSNCFACSNNSACLISPSTPFSTVAISDLRVSNTSSAFGFSFDAFAAIRAISILLVMKYLSLLNVFSPRCACIFALRASFSGMACVEPRASMACSMFESSARCGAVFDSSYSLAASSRCP